MMTTTSKIVQQQVRLQQQALQSLVAELSAPRNCRPSLSRTSAADDPLQHSDDSDDDSDGSNGSATDHPIAFEASCCIDPSFLGPRKVCYLSEFI